MLHCTQHDKSASYIIPNMQRSIHHPVYKTGKYPNCYNERQKKWYTTCILFLIQYLRLCTFATRVEEHCMQRTLQPGEPPTRLFVFIKFLEAV